MSLGRCCRGGGGGIGLSMIVSIAGSDKLDDGNDSSTNTACMGGSLIGCSNISVAISTLF